MTRRHAVFSMVLAAVGMAGAPAVADCAEGEASRITCSGETTTPLVDDRDGLTVIIESGAQVSVDNGDAIRAGGGRIDDLRTWAEMELARVYPRGCSDAGVQLYDLEPAQ